MSLFFKAELFDILSKLYSEERVLNHIETLKKLESPRGYSAFGDATLWCEDVLKKEGFSDVRRISHKADGETASFDFIMPQAWDLCGRSTLKIVEPINEIIADTDISTLYVSEYSAPTPSGGVTAEIVDYLTLDPKNPDCKGKYVFYRGYLPPYNTLCKSLADAGCAGIVFAAFETTEHEPDTPSWTNGHGHIGWYHLKEDNVAPIFCITPKKGIELIELLSKGKVVLHGEMNTKLYDGDIYTVTATIPGESEDEYAILGHLYEPFQSDDCQGFAVGVEVARMLNKLIADGVLPKPKKTLRLIFSMERYGYAAFFANHNKKILAAVSIDSFTCLASDILDTGFHITMSPLSLPFFGDMLFEEAMKKFCGDIRWKFTPGTLSDDCWMAEKTVDIPTNWCVSSSGNGKSNYHHCDAPIFDAIEPWKLKKLVPMLACFTSVLICGDRAHFEYLTKELGKKAALWLETSKNYVAGRVAAGKMSKTDALWHIKAAELYYKGRMESFNRFYPDVADTTVPSHWADNFYSILSERELSDAERKADSIRYRVISKGVPFSQAKVPSEERVCFSMVSELIWALLSPERSVLEAIRLRDSVFSVQTSDEMIEYYLSYFSFLEKYGYLEKV